MARQMNEFEKVEFEKFNQKLENWIKRYVAYEFEVGDSKLVIKNHGGDTYNVFFDGNEIDVFTAYADNERDKEWIVNDWVTDWMDENYVS